ARLLVTLLLAAALIPAALWPLLAGSLPLAVNASLSLLLGADLFLLDNTRRSLLAQWCDHLASGGIRVRRPAAVERLREAGSLLCERRGILTRGEPEITDAIPLAEDRTADDVLQLAAVAEFAARHPFSRAVLSRRTLEAGTIPRVKGFEQIPGQGVRAFLRGRELLCGNIRLLREHGFAEDVIKELSEVARPFRQRGESVIFVALGGVVQGLVALMDPLRPEAVELAHSLRRRGKRLRVLTGGDADAVEAATRELGETDVLRDLSPQERGRAVGDLVLQGLCVAVVGTREKNAPALQAASISIEWPASLQDDPAGGAGGPLGADIALAEPRLEQISSLLDASDEYHGRVRRFGRSLAAVVLPALAVAGGALYPWLGLPPSPLLAAAVCLTAHLASLRVRR
ncbi:MAG: cation-translocating P-type ATPase, partial [Planctomycetes bacterium]|nr:cation-translocating P-type ATPase [Planctomycetota bacterium]